MTKTCKDCEFISEKKKFDVETNNSIDRFYCEENDHHLKVFNPCKDFEQRTIVVKESFNWESLIICLIGGSIIGLISGIISGLLNGIIDGLIVGIILGLIVGFIDKKKIYKNSNIDEEKDEN